MSSSILVILCFLLVLQFDFHHAASLHRFHSGDCPKIESMSEFNIDRFLGLWYVLENANDNGNVCLREEFNANQEVVSQPKHNEMIDMARNEVLPHPETSKQMENNEDSMDKMEKVYEVKRSYLPFGGRQFIHETGKIRFLANDSQSEMEINYPYSETGMLNLKHYEVIVTDYDKFALIWRCQKTIFGHRRSAQLMSRYSTLDKKTMEELKSLLKHFEVEHEVQFSPVRQTECTEVPGLEPESTTRKSVADLDGESIYNSNKNTNNNINNNNNVDKNSEIYNNNGNSKNKKKLINIDIGGFHLSIFYPFW